MKKQFKNLISEKEMEKLYSFELYAYDNIIDYTNSKCKYLKAKKPEE